MNMQENQKDVLRVDKSLWSDELDKVHIILAHLEK